MDTKPTRRQLLINMERAGAAMASRLMQVAPDLAREWDRACGDWQQATALTGEPDPFAPVQAQPVASEDDAAFLKHWDTIAPSFAASHFDVAYGAARSTWFAALAATQPAAPAAEPIGYISKAMLTLLQSPDAHESNEPARLWHAKNPPSRATIPVFLASAPVPAQGEREAAARAIYSIMHPANVCLKDWDNGTMLGFENGYRDQIYRAADAVLAALAAKVQPVAELTDEKIIEACEGIFLSDHQGVRGSQSYDIAVARAVLAFAASPAKPAKPANQAVGGCGTCNDTGVVGSPPDQYFHCPECVSQQADSAGGV